MTNLRMNSLNKRLNWRMKSKSRTNWQRRYHFTSSKQWLRFHWRKTTSTSCPLFQPNLIHLNNMSETKTYKSIRLNQGSKSFKTNSTTIKCKLIVWTKNWWIIKIFPISIRI